MPFRYKPLMVDRSEDKESISRLNDEFRRCAGLVVSTISGKCFMTAGIGELASETQVEIFARVRTCCDFCKENDPHREHDFGAFTTSDGERGFWKIDYFADGTMEYGADHPADPNRPFRVLTIMLPAEY